jgi:hypothetical protein
MVEQPAVNRLVVGSSPTHGAFWTLVPTRGSESQYNPNCHGYHELSDSRCPWQLSFEGHRKSVRGQSCSPICYPLLLPGQSNDHIGEPYGPVPIRPTRRLSVTQRGCSVGGVARAGHEKLDKRWESGEWAMQRRKPDGLAADLLIAFRLGLLWRWGGQTLHSL